MRLLTSRERNVFLCGLIVGLAGYAGGAVLYRYTHPAYPARSAFVVGQQLATGTEIVSLWKRAAVDPVANELMARTMNFNPTPTQAEFEATKRMIDKELDGRIPTQRQFELDAKLRQRTLDSCEQGGFAPYDARCVRANAAEVCDQLARTPHKSLPPSTDPGLLACVAAADVRASQED